MTRAAALVAVLALALAGCAVGGGNKATTTAGTTKTAVVQTQTTKVEVLKSSAGRGNATFDPQTIYKSEGPGVVTLIALDGKTVTAHSSEALGSGFVVDGNGYIATNAHVVTSGNGTKAKQVYVQFSDGNKLPARIIGTDLDSDIALIKIDPGALRGPGAKLVPLPLGSTSEIRVGDPVAAIGSPFGEQQSLSVGVVSALNRDIQSLTRFDIGNAIQTDAAINHGNSGGPLLDGSGKVIGINAQIQSTGGGGEGVGFAIPVETIKHSVDELRTKGRVAYAYLGVSSVTLYPQLAEQLGLKQIDGALLDSVTQGGPAAKAGLRGAKDHMTFQGIPDVPVGSDLIVSVDGHRITKSEDLSTVIGVHAPGETVKVGIVRAGKQQTISVRLAKRPERGAGAR
jgi:S1-C subfamily serine protease